MSVKAKCQECTYSSLGWEYKLAPFTVNLIIKLIFTLQMWVKRLLDKNKYDSHF